MKSYNRKKKARYQKPPTPQPVTPAPSASLVSALAPLHSVARAQVVMNVTLASTANNAAEQMVAVFAGVTPGTVAGPLTKSVEEQAQDAIQDAIDELDKSDPFGTLFGEGADFPRVCYLMWREQIANLIAAHRKIEEQLIEEGDPQAHQHANDAIRNSSIAISESLSRCLRSPIRKIPVDE